MIRHSLSRIIGTTVLAVLILAAGCGDKATEPTDRPIVRPEGITEYIKLPECHQQQPGDYYTYDGCSQELADLACRRFGFEKAIDYRCSVLVCGGLETTFTVSVTCWKPE